MAGDDAVQFGLGEPDFQPPELAVEAFARAMREGRNKYTTTAGLPPLRQKIAEMWHHRIPTLDESNVCITMSGTNALLDIFLAIVNPGDKVMIPEPYFKGKKPFPGETVRREACINRKKIRLQKRNAEIKNDIQKLEYTNEIKNGIQK